MAATVRLQCVFLLVSLVFTRGQNLNCTDECCYWYTTVPSSAACSIDSFQVYIPCTVLTRHDPLTDVSVRWYWSGDQETAGVRGTLLTNSSKYQSMYFPAITPSTSETGPNALYNDLYSLNILNFNTIDFGYYWFQLVVNGSCLFPSPYGHISENGTASVCSSNIPTKSQLALPPICAGSDTSPDNCTEAHMPTSGMSLPVTTLPPNITVPDSTTLTTLVATSEDGSQLQCPYQASGSGFYSAIGVLVLDYESIYTVASATSAAARDSR